MATTLRELDVDLITRGHLEKGLERLRDEFAGTFSAETVERFMAESLEALGGARLKNFVPLFVHRFARERLRALGQVEGKIAKTVPEVLFVCVQNAGRSQMAAALLDHYAEGRVHVRSAGSAPADEINPDVVAAMSELGIDVSKEFPKPMTDEVVQAADAVITMGCGDACPIYPGKRYEDWEVDDPAEADLEGVRRIRDDIGDRVRTLLAERQPDTGLASSLTSGGRHHRHPRQPARARRRRSTRIEELGIARVYLRRRPRRLRPAAERGLRADRRARDPDDLRQLRLRDRARPRRLRLRVHRPRTTASSASSPWPGRSSTPTRRAKDFMRELPFDLRFELGEREVHLVHGSPRKVNEYLFEDKPARLYERLAAAEDADVLVFGHTHKPWIHEFGGVLFVNCGSVGKPKDGDPRGAFAILDLDDTGQVRARSSASPTTPRPSRARSPPSGLPGEYADKLLAAA